MIAGTDPATFHATQELPAGSMVVGPFPGSLQNNGERLELQRPEILSPTAWPTSRWTRCAMEIARRGPRRRTEVGLRCSGEWPHRMAMSPPTGWRRCPLRARLTSGGCPGVSYVARGHSSSRRPNRVVVSHRKEPVAFELPVEIPGESVAGRDQRRSGVDERATRPGRQAIPWRCSMRRGRL